MFLKPIIRKSKQFFLVAFVVLCLEGCGVVSTAYDVSKFTYGVVSGGISGAYDIVTGTISLLQKLGKAIDKQWGSGAKKASQKIYVKYTHNYKSRAIINYEKGTVDIETMDTEDPYQSLHDAIVTTLLTPSDPRSVDLFSDREIELGKEPFLLGQIKDENGNSIATKEEAIRYATFLISNKVKSYQVIVDGHKKDVFGVRLTLVKGHEYLRARRFMPFIEEYSKKYDVPRSLILAVIETESAFNPFAVSSTGAIGLMQIMQKSAGAEVYEYLNGRKGTPSKDMLFDSKTNIQYGTVYLHLLFTRHLGDIQHPLSREYAVSAAYNTGPGNLLRTFNRDKDAAINRINSFKPDDLFRYLQKNLPYDETRRYIVKIRDNQKRFIGW